MSMQVLVQNQARNTMVRCHFPACNKPTCPWNDTKPDSLTADTAASIMKTPASDNAAAKMTPPAMSMI